VPSPTSPGIQPPPCPRCGSGDIAKICYGEPVPSAELDREIEAKKIVLGGCFITGNDPEWHCNACSKRFRDAKPSRPRPRQ
jgi:hypothetical protein